MTHRLKTTALALLAFQLFSFSAFSQTAAIRKDLSTTPPTVSDNLQFTGDITLPATVSGGGSSFATTAQGALADTAVQPGDIGTAAERNTGNSPGNVPLLDAPLDVNEFIIGGGDAGSLDSVTPATARIMLNVEDGAQPTNTAAVTAAGALMDSEITNLPAVKAFDPTDYEPAGVAAADITDATATGQAVITAADAAALRDAAGASAGVFPPATLPAATTSAAGAVELATAAEAVEGSDTGRAVTPAGLSQTLAEKINPKSFPHGIFISSGGDVSIADYSLPDDFSIIGSFRINEFISNTTVVSKYLPSGRLRSFALFANANEMIWRVSADGTVAANSDTSLAVQIKNARTYTFALTFSGGDLAFYLDGNLIDTASGVPSPYESTAPVLIGRYGVSPTAVINGIAREFAFFNRELTAAQVASIYSQGIPSWLAAFPENKWGATAAITAGPLEVGQLYVISTYAAGDDFTNVGAASNATGVEFIATGTTPTTWSNGSELTALGAVIYLPMSEGVGYQLRDRSINRHDALLSTSGWQHVTPRNTGYVRDFALDANGATVDVVDGSRDILPAGAIITRALITNNDGDNIAAGAFGLNRTDGSNTAEIGDNAYQIDAGEGGMLIPDLTQDLALRRLEIPSTADTGMDDFDIRIDYEIID